MGIWTSSCVLVPIRAFIDEELMEKIWLKTFWRFWGYCSKNARGKFVEIIAKNLVVQRFCKYTIVTTLLVLTFFFSMGLGPRSDSPTEEILLWLSTSIPHLVSMFVCFQYVAFRIGLWLLWLVCWFIYIDYFKTNVID